MKLTDAYKEWAALPQNKTMGARYRHDFKSVLLDSHGELDIRELTEFRVRKIMTETTAPQAAKTRAASALVHVLGWAAKEGECIRPTFDHTVAGSAKPGQEATDTGGCPETAKPVVATTRHRRRGGGRPHIRCCRLNPESLEVEGTFDCLVDAAQSVPGANGKNISRAIKKKGMAYGFYWCRVEDAKTFSPGARSRRSPTQRKRAAAMGDASVGIGHPTACPVDQAVPSALSRFTVEEICQELKRRGWKGTLSQVLEV